MSEKGFVVLITGCSSGIGQELARQFASAGHRVFASARKPETMDDLKQEGLDTLALDVTDQQSIERAVAQVIDEAGRLDLLVNNAGYGLIGPMAEIPLADFRRQLETNVTGPLALVQTVVPQMIKQGGGRILNVGSVSGVLTTPFGGAYCATKAALHALSDAMRLELAPFGISVTTLQPGAVRSKFGDTASRLLAESISADSIYASISSFIQKRAQVSQDESTDTTQFAKDVVKAVCRDNPPAILRLGALSFKAPAYNWALPTALTDSILKKMFGLNQLKKS